MSQGAKSIKITKRVVDGIKPNGTDFYVFDSELTGFGIRVRKTGGMSYIVRYRAGYGNAAPVRRVTIAKVGKVTPDQARDAAKDILASVVKGQDPARERADDRAAATVASLAADFLRHIEAKRKPNTLAQYTHMLNAYVNPALGTRKAANVTASDIAALHLSLRAKSTTANRVRDVVSSMYGWAIKGKILPKMENPAEGIEKYREAKRDRFLTSEEIGRLGAAIREAETDGIPWEPDPAKKTKHAPKAVNRRVKVDPTVAAALRLFILTGARLREILHLTWEMVDLERGLLLLPDSKTDEKAIILNAPAQLILSELPRIDRYVIPGKPRKNAKGKFESRPRSDLKRPWTMVRRRAGLAADADNPKFRVRIHDLRHTHASIGVGSNMGLPIIGKLLGHAQARTTERYAHLETDPLRKASNAIGKKISDAMGDNGKAVPPPADNVVSLRSENG
jgi:integrase